MMLLKVLLIVLNGKISLKKLGRLEEKVMVWEELGMSAGTAILVLIALYYIIKWAVKNGIKQAYKDITGKETLEGQEERKYEESIQKRENKNI